MTAAQVREVIARLIAAGHWHQGDPGGPGRLRRRVRRDPAGLAAGGPARGAAGPVRFGTGDVAARAAAPARHQRPALQARPRAGPGRPCSCPDPHVATSTATSRYGTAVTAAWDRVHPRLTHRAAWLDHDGLWPVIEGTLIRLQVDYLPGDRDPKPVWLWWSRTGAAPADVDLVLAVVLAQIRSRTHIQVLRAGSRVDRPEDPRPGRRGPVDLADHRLLRPAAPGPAAGRRLAPPLGTPGPARAADPGPGPPRVPEHPREGCPARQCTETRQGRSGWAAWVEEPPSGTTP